MLCSAAARNLAMPAVDKWRPSRQSFREAAVQVEILQPTLLGGGVWGAPPVQDVI